MDARDVTGLSGERAVAQNVGGRERLFPGRQRAVELRVCPCASESVEACSSPIWIQGLLCTKLHWAARCKSPTGAKHYFVRDAKETGRSTVGMWQDSMAITESCRLFAGDPEGSHCAAPPESDASRATSPQSSSRQQPSLRHARPTQ